MAPHRSRIALRVARSVVTGIGAILSLARTAYSDGSFARRDFADPFVLRDGTSYFAFATNGSGSNIQIARSDDLASWTPLPDALPRLGAWAKDERSLVWAPSVLKRGARYVLYYTARDRASDFQCVSRAVSDRAAGPYVDDLSRPMICQVAGEQRFCGSIDASPFVDTDGAAYLLWKSDENAAACKAAPRLWSQRLADDGLSVTGAATALLAMDRTWERPIIEAPSMVKDGERYYLFYSANWYESDRYAVGYATCAGARGPCTKRTIDAPLHASAGSELGPGGQELFQDLTGAWWMVYHAWTAPKTSYAEGGARSLRLMPVRFEEGQPIVGIAPLVATANSGTTRAPENEHARPERVVGSD